MLRRSLLALSALLLAGPALAQQPKTLKVVLHSDLKILDPIWTTAYIVRNHGYLIYDTLFALDVKLEPKPQMVESWTVSDDKLTWTFKLRDGLKWHDGTPVTTADVIPSIKRFTDKDVQGGLLAKFTQSMAAVDDRTFSIVLKEPFGLMLKTLAKSASVPLFVMPKRVAELPISQQLADTTGSGPFIFKKDEWKPGEKVVYVRNPDYKPRAEPPSSLAGGKVAKVERVEWIWIPDAQTQVAALGNGEIDIIQAPPHDLLPILSQDRNAKLFNSNPLGSQYEFRFNTLFKPFDDPRIRHAAMVAFGQEEFLKATIGDPQWFKVCKAPFVCGTPLGSDEGMKDVLNQDAARARELLRQAGYDGTPVVLLQATDVAAMTNLGPVAKAQLEAAGFKVDMQSMDWQTLVARRAKKDPPDKGGWSALFTYSGAADILNPVSANLFNASCDKATYGWPCDAEIEKLRDAFARETDPAKQKQIAMELQKRWVEAPTFVDLGQLYQPSALRTNIDGMLAAPATVFWNITKK